MKKIVYFFAILLVVVGCKDEATEPELGLLQKWGLGADGYVMVDGKDITSDYQNFTLEFQENESGNVMYVTNGSYTFTETVDLWSYVDNTKTSIIRSSDDLIIHFTLEDKHTITLTFTITTPPSGGRVGGSVGEFEMRLNKL